MSQLDQPREAKFSQSLVIPNPFPEFGSSVTLNQNFGPNFARSIKQVHWGFAQWNFQGKSIV
jgi:hypothetical protein